MQPETFSTFDLAPGRTVLGRFKIEAPNRHGGLAATFKAHDTKHDRSCELIVFPAALFDGREQSEDYKRSLEPWLSVRSPHVATLRELLLAQDGSLVEVCDPPPGQSLRDELKEHTAMPATEAVSLGLQMLAGLMAVHERGLVHGDIKPQTVFISSKENGRHAMLVDGGITAGLWNVKHLGDRTALIGTPFYAPVEQFGGESPDVQSDVYNVATVLFELVTGVLPWPGRTLLEVFQAKLDRRTPSMRQRAPHIEVEPELESVVGRGLTADRAGRWPDAAAFHAALEPLAGRG
jgi:serine/threonine protein kinase